MKKYYSLTGGRVALGVTKGETVISVTIEPMPFYYSTKDKDVQKGIEEHSFFKQNKIGIISDEGKTSINPDIPTLAKVFEDVTNLNDAAKVLRANPYKVHTSKLTSKEAILDLAASLNISFPNLVVE